jgi:DNA-binding NarL/FixJ family response regulator
LPRTPSAPPLRILLVDDHPGTLAALRAALSQYPELHVIGDARNGRDAIAQANALRPDLVLMDIHLPLLDGVTATSEIKAEGLPSKVILLTDRELAANGTNVFKAGANAFVQKRQSLDSFMSVFSDVASLVVTP